MIPVQIPSCFPPRPKPWITFDFIIIGLFISIIFFQKLYSLLSGIVYKESIYSLLYYFGGFSKPVISCQFAFSNELNEAK